jgi:TAG lipase/steryl ester hydrolase/phospholipase A2/LPA acyltransferase
LPRIVCGSSVGSVIGAFICSKSYSELSKILQVSYFKDKNLLKYKRDTLAGIIAGLMSGEAILDNNHLRNVMRNEIGDLTFKEIHDKFKWNLNVTVTDS